MQGPPIFFTMAELDTLLKMRFFAVSTWDSSPLSSREPSAILQFAITVRVCCLLLNPGIWTPTPLQPRIRTLMSWNCPFRGSLRPRSPSWTTICFTHGLHPGHGLSSESCLADDLAPLWWLAVNSMPCLRSAQPVLFHILGGSARPCKSVNIFQHISEQNLCSKIKTLSPLAVWPASASRNLLSVPVLFQSVGCEQCTFQAPIQSPHAA